MSDFDAAIPVLMQHEGGWLSREKDPVGGETNWGISELIIRKQKLTTEELGVDPNNIGQLGWLKAMPRANAIAIYRAYFWLPVYEQILDQTSATKLFDAAVNMGAATAHMLAQGAVGVAQDGQVGPLTVQAINQCNEGIRGFVQAFADKLELYYRNVAANRPPAYAALWLPVWLNRARWGLPASPAPSV